MRLRWFLTLAALTALGACGVIRGSTIGQVGAQVIPGLAPDPEEAAAQAAATGIAYSAG